jgi:hypothetical protein
MDDGSGVWLTSPQIIPLRTHTIVPPYVDTDLQNRWYVSDHPFYCQIPYPELSLTFQVGFRGGRSDREFRLFLDCAAVIIVSPRGFCAMKSG